MQSKRERETEWEREKSNELFYRACYKHTMRTMQHELNNGIASRQHSSHDKHIDDLQNIMLTV